MENGNLEQDHFGCENCFPASAEDAWIASKSLSISANLIDESHFIVSVRQCLNCQQKYLFVFTETVDWIGGEDPQYRTILPLTQDEASFLLRMGSDNIRSKLGSVAPSRRSLRRDFPSDSKPFAYWNFGVHTLIHD